MSIQDQEEASWGNFYMDIIILAQNNDCPNQKMKFKGEFMFWITVLEGMIQGKVQIKG